MTPWEHILITFISIRVVLTLSTMLPLVRCSGHLTPWAGITTLTPP